MSLVDELAAARLAKDEATDWQRTKCDVLEEWWGDRERIARVPRLSLTGLKAVDMSSRRRYVSPQCWPIPLGELARLYLHDAIAAADPPARSPLSAGRVPYRKTHIPMMNIPPPYYFDPPERRTGNWARVDLSNAYWQILSAGTMDMCFDADELTLGVGHCRYHRAADIGKELGRPIAGILGSFGFKEYRYGVLSPKPRFPGDNRSIPSHYFAPDAYGYLQWTLHGLALEAIRDFNAASWVVDGAILHEKLADDYASHLWHTWHLRARVSPRGRGHLYGLSRWRIGNETRGIDNDPRPTDAGLTSNLMAISPADVERLRFLRSWLLDR